MATQTISLDDVASVKFNGQNVKTIKLDGDTIWQQPSTDYVKFHSASPITLSLSTKQWDGTLEYSYNGKTWTTWDNSALNGTDIYLRGTGNTKINSKFSLSSSNGIECIGDIMTLLDYATVGLGGQPTMAISCFNSLFSGCTKLTTAPTLSATTLSANCYYNMFKDCTALTTAPALPATTLTANCYYQMFAGCTALTAAPELPATTLDINCYFYMFKDCTALTSAPTTLPATTLAISSYACMFQGCTALTTAPSISATTLALYCCQNMFQDCTALTTAPSTLPATTLAEGCYYYMFKGCTSLTTAPSLPATTLANSCYDHMFQYSGLTSAPALPATTLKSWCYKYMFDHCSSLVYAPLELPGLTVEYGSYDEMFSYCTSLRTVPIMRFTAIGYEDTMVAMFKGCTSLEELPDLSYSVYFQDEYAYNNMFEGCTKIKLSTTQTGEYTTPYVIRGYGSSDATYRMFANTGGTFTGDPTLGTTYYTSNTVKSRSLVVI